MMIPHSLSRPHFFMAKVSVAAPASPALSLWVDQAPSDSKAHEMGHVAQLQLGHHRRPMGLDRLDADDQLIGDLLIRVALTYELQHLAFAARQTGIYVVGILRL